MSEAILVYLIVAAVLGIYTSDGHEPLHKALKLPRRAVLIICKYVPRKVGEDLILRNWYDKYQYLLIKEGDQFGLPMVPLHGTLLLGEILSGSREEVLQLAVEVTGYDRNQLKVCGDKLHDVHARHGKDNIPTLIKEYYLIKRITAANYDSESDENELCKWEVLPPQGNLLSGYGNTTISYVLRKFVQERMEEMEETEEIENSRKSEHPKSPKPRKQGWFCGGNTDNCVFCSGKMTESFSLSDDISSKKKQK